MQKTSIFFISNTMTNVIKQIVEKLRAKRSGDAKKYLGLPSIAGKSKYRTFRGV